MWTMGPNFCLENLIKNMLKLCLIFLFLNL